MRRGLHPAGRAKPRRTVRGRGPSRAPYDNVAAVAVAWCAPRHRRAEPILAAWELRIGDLRVYYDVVEEPEHRVCILRAGDMVRERVRIRGEYVSMTL
jgi:hypothetical protein